MNVELLRKIAAVIQEKPTEFGMHAFHCGAVHCIGGWAEVLSNKEYMGTEEMAATLGCDEDAVDRLCYPDPLNAWEKFGGWHPTAEQAAARIEHFIATDGRE